MTLIGWFSALNFHRVQIGKGLLRHQKSVLIYCKENWPRQRLFNKISLKCLYYCPFSVEIDECINLFNITYLISLC